MSVSEPHSLLPHSDRGCRQTHHEWNLKASEVEYQAAIEILILGAIWINTNAVAMKSSNI